MDKNNQPGSHRNQFNTPVSYTTENASQNIIRYQCPLCPTNYAQIRYLREHIKQKHPEQNLDVMDFGKTAYYSQQNTVDQNNTSNFSLNMPGNMPTETLPTQAEPMKTIRYQCPYCPVSYPHDFGLKEHVYEHHRAMYETTDFSKTVFYSSVNPPNMPNSFNQPGTVQDTQNPGYQAPGNQVPENNVQGGMVNNGNMFDNLYLCQLCNNSFGLVSWPI